MSVLSTQLSYSIIKYWVQDFFTWWYAELGQLVPVRVRHFFLRPRPDLILNVSNGLPILAVRHGLDLNEYWIPKGVDGESVDIASSLVLAQQQFSGLKHEVVIRLGEDTILRRRLHIAPLNLRDLRALIGLELDKLTPFTPERCYFDIETVERPRRPQNIIVDVVVARRSFVEALLLLCADHKLKVVCVTVCAQNHLLPDSISLFRPKLPPQWRRAIHSKAIVLSIVLAAIAAFDVGATLFHQRSAIKELTKLVAEMRTAAIESDSLHSEITRREQTNSILAEKRSVPSALSLLNDVTRLLPDSAWLTGFELNGSQVVLIGQGQAAADIVPLLEKSTLFGEVRFRAPVVPADQPGLERFEMAATIRKQAPK